MGLGLRVQGFGGWCRICGGSVYLGIPATLDLLDNVRLIQGLGFGIGVWGLGFRIWGEGCRVLGKGFRVWVLGFRIWG